VDHTSVRVCRAHKSSIIIGARAPGTLASFQRWTLSLIREVHPAKVLAAVRHVDVKYDASRNPRRH